jgi:two-component sensor histidine kinase
MPLFGLKWFYYPEVAIVTGFCFVLFNIYAGVYIFAQGYKQARLFVLGWAFLVVAFSLMILDGLGLISVMHKLSNIILFLTAFEAMVLSLAFTDRYMIVKAEKNKNELLLVNMLQERQKVIEFEIEKQTQELNGALKNTKVLLKELHHRTKNNLQLILSLVRMQAKNGTAEIQTYSKSLESRINAIARTHELLYLKSDLTNIGMQEYIEELSYDLQSLCDKEIEIVCDVEQIYMPLREASYIGLVVNEVITNSIKYAKSDSLKVYVGMSKNADSYTLKINDNGVGLGDELTQGIGMKLIKTLMQEQLDGGMEIYNKDGLHYVMEFGL